MKAFTLVLVAAVLSGCASSYKANGIGGGFTETQLTQDAYRIGFQGNGYTSADRAADLALLRSADVGLKNGFTHFIIVDGKSEVQSSAYTTGGGYNTTGTINTIGNTSYLNARTTGGSKTYNIAKPSQTNTVLYFKGKPELDLLIYDVAFLCDSLGRKYEVRCGEK